MPSFAHRRCRLARRLPLVRRGASAPLPGPHVTGILVLVVVACLVGVRPAPQAASTAPVLQPPARAAVVARGDELRQQECTRCHNLPPPDVLPKSRWRGTVAQMFLRRQGLPEPPGPKLGDVALSDEFAAIAAYYEAHAPETLPPPEPWPPPGAGSPPFRQHELWAVERLREPTVANVRFADLDGDARPELIVSDMRYGVVLRGRPYEPGTRMDTLGDVRNPAHATVVDLDRDGLKDLLVADLGELSPGDHTNGAVGWFRGRPDGKFTIMELGGFPRVADVEATDVDGDGDLDLLVAAFGWRAVGHIAVLVNETTDWSRPSFRQQVVDARAGSIHVPPIDLDGNGRMDFIALVSQQHERVLAFYSNAPQPGFTMETLYAAPHPNWGSSGIQLVDLDGDGDLDILLAHGDTLDDFLVKPYHGIQWLENLGGFEMKAHTLATMPGVHRAIAADVDGDGDQDVLATSLIAFDAGPAEKTFASIVWLEQVARGRFERRTLEMGRPRHATMDAADYDLDGDIDFAVGNFGIAGAPPVTLWENLRIDKGPRAQARSGRREQGR